MSLMKHVPLVILLAVVLCVQYSFWRNSEPLHFPDSKSYLEPAQNILRGEWSGFYFRTPGYPVFLALIQSAAPGTNHDQVVAVQFFIACFLPVLLYGIYRPLLRSGWSALIPSLIFFLDWPSVGLPATILTEPLTQVLLVATVAVAIPAIQKLRWWTAPVLGILLFALLMVRPAFQLLSWCLMLAGLGVGLYFSRSRWKQLLVWWSCVIVVAQGLTAAWCFKNYKDTGNFSVSLLTGIALINHVGPLVREVPEGRFEPWRTTHLKVLEDQPGNYINAGYPAMQHMAEAYGMHEWEIAEGYKRLSLWLIARHPVYYLRSAARAFYSFWVEPPHYLVEPSHLSSYIRQHGFWGPLYGVLDAHFWRRPSRLLACAVAFVCGIFAYMVVMRGTCRSVLTGAVLGTVVLYTALIHAAVNATEMGRYRLAVQPLLFSFVLFLVVSSFEALGVRVKARMLSPRVSNKS